MVRRSLNRSRRDIRRKTRDSRKSKMAAAEADEMPDTSKQEPEVTKLLPPSGRVTVLAREKNTAQLRGWCQICGDAAYNRNFGALSCDSCKAFFRRNVNRTPFGRCEGKCEITIESRTFCKKCRFNKCLSVGMKRHLVKGRGMKEKEEQFTCDSTATGLEVDTTSRRSSDADDSLLLEAEMAATLTDQEITALMDTELQAPFTEMMNAWKKTYGAYMYSETSKPQMVEIMNLIEGPLKTLVSFAKNLPLFKCLPVEDQISLLKGCAAEAAIIRSSLSYDSTKNGWNVSAPGGKRVDVSAAILKSSAQEVFQSVVVFYKGVQRVIKGDEVLVYFMIILSLFSSDREKLNKPEIVQDTQQLYASVLQSYCRIRHPAEKMLTARILMKTVDIRDVGNCAIKLFQSADNDQLRPLLHEIFDLPAPNGERDSEVEVKTETAENQTPDSQVEMTSGKETHRTHDLSMKVNMPRSSSVESHSSSRSSGHHQLPNEGRSEVVSRSTSVANSPDGQVFYVDSVDSHSEQLGGDARTQNRTLLSRDVIDLTTGHMPGPSQLAESSVRSQEEYTSQPNQPTSPVNIKMAVHHPRFSPDCSQPPVKNRRMEERVRHNSLQTYPQVSPPAGSSGSPFNNAERRLSAPDTTSSAQNVYPSNVHNNFQGMNMIYDFSMHKRGANSQFGDNNS